MSSNIGETKNAVAKHSQLSVSSWFRPEELPPECVTETLKTIQDGRLFRYDYGTAEESPVSVLEREFADSLGARYGLALNSCGSAMQVALSAIGAKPGTSVLIPAFTFTAVVSAVVNAGCTPVLVDIDSTLCIDLESLERAASNETKILLLSYMRGRVSNLNAILEFCSDKGILVIEDCAHSLGTSWNGVPTGRFGLVSCFSFHDKLLSSGEGGMLVTDDDNVLMRAAVMSGTYESLWKKHICHPRGDNPYQGHLPQYSMRMSAVSASILRPQIKLTSSYADIYRKINASLSDALSKSPLIVIPPTDSNAELVCNTIQFHYKSMSEAQMSRAVKLANDCGVPLSRFGPISRNDRCVWNWHYLPTGEEYSVPETRAKLQGCCDLRLRRGMDEDRISCIADIIVRTAEQASQEACDG